jgi:hypothetical protein
MILSLDGLATFLDESAVRWRTSARSASAGSNCVELGPLPGPHAGVAVRDSKDRAGGVLLVTDESWVGFLGGVKRGGFDLR